MWQPNLSLKLDSTIVYDWHQILSCSVQTVKKCNKIPVKWYRSYAIAKNSQSIILMLVRITVLSSGYVKHLFELYLVTLCTNMYKKDNHILIYHSVVISLVYQITALFLKGKINNKSSQHSWYNTMVYIHHWFRELSSSK